MKLRYGVVVETHPEDHSVDVVMTDNFARIAGVQVQTSNGNGAAGSNDLYCPEPKAGADKWDITKVGPENPIAAIDFSGHMPVVTGFRYPQVGQMTFKEKNLRLDRHSSDVYSTLNAAGDYEKAWPNGTFLRVAASPDHVDLAGKDNDGKWKIGKNTGAALHLRVVLGAGKLDLHVDPAGNLMLLHDGDLTIHTKGKASVQVDGTADIKVSGNTSLTTPELKVDAGKSQFTGDVQVDGGLKVAGGSTLAGVTSNGHDVGSSHRHNNSGGSGLGGTPQ